MNKSRRKKIPEELYSEGPEGLKYYDVKLGTGALAKEGERVAVSPSQSHVSLLQRPC